MRKLKHTGSRLMSPSTEKFILRKQLLRYTLEALKRFWFYHETMNRIIVPWFYKVSKCCTLSGPKCRMPYE